MSFRSVENNFSPPPTTMIAENSPSTSCRSSKNSLLDFGQSDQTSTSDEKIVTAVTTAPKPSTVSRRIHRLKDFCRKVVASKKSQQKRTGVKKSVCESFKKVVGRQLDKTFGREEEQVDGVASHSVSPQDSPTETETFKIHCINRTRKRRQTDSCKVDPNRRRSSDTWGGYLHPFDQAFQNCQKTFVVAQKLQQLLTNLLELECKPLASGCHTNDTNSRSTIASDIPECELMRNFGRDKGLQHIRQMKRMAMWKCNEIKDELRGLQISFVCDKGVDGARLFIERCGRDPIPGFENVDMRHPKPVKMDIEQFLEGAITKDSVGCAMDYWPTLEREFRQMQTAYESESGTVADYGLDKGVVVDMIDSHHRSSVISAKTARLCTNNIETESSAQ
ncbi:hypothetical protein MMC26_006751 [Xylographa opegraphella]|nr:hypothetical protein [Xylographa opegraphella]